MSKDNIFLGSEKILDAKLTPDQYFPLLGVVSAIPNECYSTIERKKKKFMLNRIFSLIFFSSADKGRDV